MLVHILFGKVWQLHVQKIVLQIGEGVLKMRNRRHGRKDRRRAWDGGAGAIVNILSILSKGNFFDRG